MISKFLSKLNKEELKVAEKQDSNIKIQKVERIMRVLVDEIKNLVVLHDKLNNRLKDLDSQLKVIKSNFDQLNSEFKNEKEKKEDFEERLTNIESNMSKFVSLYEAITNIYNPFIKKNSNSYFNNSQKSELVNNNVSGIGLTPVEKKKSVVIEDSLTGSKKTVEYDDEKQSSKTYDIPEANRLNSDLAKKEAIYLKYSSNKFNDLKNYLSNFNISDDQIKELLKTIYLFNPKPIQFNGQTYDSLKKLGLVLIPQITADNYQKISNQLRESFKNTSFYSFISSSNSADELKKHILILIINEYINKQLIDESKKSENNMIINQNN